MYIFHKWMISSQNWALPTQALLMLCFLKIIPIDSLSTLFCFIIPYSRSYLLREIENLFRGTNLLRNFYISQTFSIVPKIKEHKEGFFTVSNPPKCIANFRTLPMHFKWDLMSYQTQKIIKEIVIDSPHKFYFF